MLVCSNNTQEEMYIRPLLQCFRAKNTYNTVEPPNADTLVPSKVSSVKRCPLSGGFQYISGGRDNAYSMPLSTLEVHSRALLCCTLAGKGSQKLVLCVPVLL